MNAALTRRRWVARHLWCLFASIAFVLDSGNAIAAPDFTPAPLDRSLPAYEPRQVAVPANARYVLPDGTVHIVSGNRGMGVVLAGFNALFERTHPGTKFRIDYNREGNSVNMAALVHGITLVCPLGRDLNASELALYGEVVGGKPPVIKIAHGTLTSARMTAGLAIYVNKDNPVRKLTMNQLARIFTTGAPGGDLTQWGQVGATGEWASRPIHIYGTPEASGYGDFMLKKKWSDRPFAPGYESFDLAAQIVKRVGEDSSGIGFAGQGFLTPATRLVALADATNGPYMEGTQEEVASGRYPLDRTVGLAFRHVAGEPIDSFVKEYLRLILSREGQAIVAAEPEGFVPLNAAQVAEERARLDGLR
jgi:phosphate transport system substrate-binding protein